MALSHATTVSLHIVHNFVITINHFSLAIASKNTLYYSLAILSIAHMGIVGVSTK